MQTFREFYQQLSEAPVQTGLGFRDPLMDVTAVNVETTKQTVLSLPEIAQFYYGDRVFSLHREAYEGDKFEDNWVDTERSLTAVQFVFKEQSDDLYALGVVQHSEYKSLARALVFNYYLEKWSSLVSDSQHTTQGERYWRKLIDSALKSGYSVEKIQGDAKTHVSFASDTEDAWGNDIQAANTVFRISKAR